MQQCTKISWLLLSWVIHHSCRGEISSGAGAFESPTFQLVTLIAWVIKLILGEISSLAYHCASLGGGVSRHWFYFPSKPTQWGCCNCRPRKKNTWKEECEDGSCFILSTWEVAVIQHWTNMCVEEKIYWVYTCLPQCIIKRSQGRNLERGTEVVTMGGMVLPLLYNLGPLA